MTIHLETQSDLEEAVHSLVKRDPRLKPVLATAGMPALRRREPGFAGLAHIVCGQQLSTASAAAIWGRLSTAFDPFDHDVVRRARTDRLGRLGLSAAKIKTLKHLARDTGADRAGIKAMTTIDFVVAKDDIDQCKMIATELPGADALPPDALLVKVDRFAFTANNITYAVLGDELKYWQLFPAPNGFGNIPVWGFGEIIASRHPNVALGERLFGYF